MIYTILILHISHATVNIIMVKKHYPLKYEIRLAQGHKPLGWISVNLPVEFTRKAHIEAGDPLSVKLTNKRSIIVQKI